MSYIEIKKELDKTTYEDAIKAILQYEFGIDEDEILDEIYRVYMERSCVLISDEMQEIVEDIRSKYEI